MTPLSAFRSRIAPRVPTALDYTIDLAVLDAAIDFCEQTLICKGALDPVLTVPGEPQCDLDAVSTNQSVIKIMRAWAKDIELTAIAEDDVDTPLMYDPNVAGLQSASGMPRAFTEPAPGAIALYPIPDAAYPLTIRAAMKPKRSAKEVEDVLFENWVEEISHGALQRLFLTPGMPFTNDKLAVFHAGQFKAGVNKALLEAARGRTRAERMVRPVWI